jgi:TPR repeat protein
MESRLLRCCLAVCAFFWLPFALAAGAADDVKKFEAFKVKADLGDAASQYSVGVCYATGKGVRKDEFEAYAYWSLAATSNNRARSSLTTLEADLTSSARLFGQQRAKDLQKEIEDNIVASKTKGGVAPKPGLPGKKAEPMVKGVPVKPEEPPVASPAPAVRAPEIAGQTDEQRRIFGSLYAAAQSGDSRAQYLLGTVYRFGKLGVVKDGPNSVTWFRKSAEQGEPKGQYYLGRSYFDFDGYTTGVAKDTRLAVSWWRQSAAQGDADAQEALAFCYGKGFGGLVQNEIEAYAYLILASRSNASAAGRRNEIEAGLSPESLRAGMERSKELLAAVSLGRRSSTAPRSEAPTTPPAVPKPRGGI